MSGELVPADPGEFLFYQTDDGQTRIRGPRRRGNRLALPEGDGRVVPEGRSDDQRTHPQHLRRRRTPGGGNYPEIPDSSNRGGPPSRARGRTLQPGRHHLRGLPRQVLTRHAVPHLGHATAARVHRQRVHDGRRPAQAGRRRQLLRRAARPHPRHPLVRTSLLAEGAGHLRHQHRLRRARPRHRNCSSRRSRTRCTGPFTGRPPPKSSTVAPTRANRTWG